MNEEAEVLDKKTVMFIIKRYIELKERVEDLESRLVILNNMNRQLIDNYKELEKRYKERV